jgi:hypothetical protein
MGVQRVFKLEIKSLRMPKLFLLGVALELLLYLKKKIKESNRFRQKCMKEGKRYY